MSLAMPPRILLSSSRFPLSNLSQRFFPNHTNTSLPSLRQISQYRRPPPRYNRFSGAQNFRTRWTTSPRFRYTVVASGLGGSAFYAYNLERVPVSGRLRFNWVPASVEEQMGQEMYEQVMREYRSKVLPETHPKSRMVRRVLERLIPNSGLVAEGRDGMGSWEVRVIESEEVNAFVIPGCVKRFFCSGLRFREEDREVGF